MMRGVVTLLLTSLSIVGCRTESSTPQSVAEVVAISYIMGNPYEARDHCAGNALVQVQESIQVFDAALREGAKRGKPAIFKVFNIKNVSYEDGGNTAIVESSVHYQRYYKRDNEYRGVDEDVKFILNNIEGVWKVVQVDG